MNRAGGLWLCLALIRAAVAAWAEQVPTGTHLEIRLQQPISTFVSAKDTSISALLIAPLRRNGRMLLPLGTRISGRLARVQRVGTGVKHETAALVLEFDSIELPNGRRVQLPSRVLEVENVRETVDKQGKIRGVRSTDTLSYRAAGVARRFSRDSDLATQLLEPVGRDLAAGL